VDREKCFEAEGQVGEQLCGDEEERREEKIRELEFLRLLMLR